MILLLALMMSIVFKFVEPQRTWKEKNEPTKKDEIQNQELKVKGVMDYVP